MDMSRYLGLFVTEASEHLEGLGRDLVELEKSGGPGAQGAPTPGALIDSMFRHAHSVKGMASSMGFEPIAVLAHRSEDLVEAVRQDAGRLDRELVDLLLAATDTMLAQVRAVAEARPADEASALLAQLTARVSAITGQQVAPTRVAKTRVSVDAPAAAPAAAAPAPAAPAATAAPLPPRSDAALGLPPRFSVRLRIAPSCQVPGVRAFLVHKRLSGLGNIFDLRPALDDLKAGRIPEGLIQLELETGAGEDGVRAALRTVSEVEILSLKPGGASAPPPAPPAAAPAVRAAANPAAPSAAPASGEAARAAAASASGVVGGEGSARTVRVRTELLDYFLDTVGELLLATARLREVGKTLPENVRPPMEEGVYRLHALVKDLHDKVMTARMTPLSVITDRLPRAARDIARRKEREVDLVISGAEIELDRAILDDLADPLLHLLRNCIDHGLESPEERVAAKKPPKGRVLVSVRRQRDRVVVELEDDGRGMNAEKLKAAALARGLITQETASRMSDREAFLLACAPGVSTAKDITDISGRGVGMDAVKRAVENVGGTLEIESEAGRGTRFTLKLPLTVAVVQLLLVGVGEEVFGLPIAKVLGATEADGDALSRSRETPLLPHGNALLPVHFLETLVGVPGAAGRVRPFVVMESDTGRLALAVDRLLGQEEVVLKALSRPLDLLPGLSGVTILGTGRPVFILDVPRLLSA
ncbi:chemotaxis protein CheW [Aggregicoccus sp. 17bor-14]|uniref:ATP-binding protein n=1 Tax=Myxococcaceae TaxID=31 RepID=UPI00351A4B1D